MTKEESYVVLDNSYIKISWAFEVFELSKHLCIGEKGKKERENFIFSVYIHIYMLKFLSFQQLKESWGIQISNMCG